MAFLLWPPLAPLYTIDNYILVAAVAVKCHVSSHILVSFVGTVPLPAPCFTAPRTSHEGGGGGRVSAARFLRPASFPRDIREERQKPTVDRILRRAANEPSAKISQSRRRALQGPYSG